MSAEEDIKMDIARLDGFKDNSPEIIRELSLSFIKKRMQSSATSEDIRRTVLSKLQLQLEQETSTTKLLSILKVLGEQGSSDLSAMIAADRPSGPGGKGNTNIFNISGVQHSPTSGVSSAVSSESLSLLNDLLSISESITNKIEE
jgi:hypothetical protein